MSFVKHMNQTFNTEMMNEVQQTPPTSKGSQNIPFSECLLFPQIFIVLMDCAELLHQTSSVCSQCKKQFERNLHVCGNCRLKRICSEECMELSFGDGESHQKSCIKRKSSTGRHIREAALTESHKVKNAQVLSADHLYNWLRAFSIPSVAQYRKKHSLAHQLNGPRSIILMSLYQMLLGASMRSEKQHRLGAILCHTYWCRVASIVNIILATKKTIETVETVSHMFYKYLTDILERDEGEFLDKNKHFKEVKSYPACRVVFEEKRDGGALKKIGPFWCLVEDYKYLCDFEFSKDEISKMKPFVSQIENWDPVEQWKKNRDNKPSDLLTITIPQTD